MEKHQWLNSILASAALGWAVYCHFRDRQPRIKVNCAVLENIDNGKMNNPYRGKTVVFAATNTGSIPVLVMGIEVSFKQINYSEDESIIKICSDPMLLGMKDIKHMRYSLRELWMGSLTLKDCVKKVRVPDTNLWTHTCDIETIYVEDSSGNKWKANSKEIERINRELLEVAFLSQGRDNQGQGQGQN